MKQVIIFTVVLFLFSSVFAQKTVIDVINTDAQFSNLKDALAASQDTEVQDLVKRLGDVNSTTTFFAPNNNAFPKNATVTASYLQYSLVGQTVSNLVDGQLLATLLSLPSLGNNTQRVKVTNSAGKFQVSGAAVSQNFSATNGHVYSIDANLTVPADLLSIVKNTAQLSTLASLVQTAGIGAALSGNSLTAFAPTNDAFAKLPSYLVNFLTNKNATNSNALLVALLSYHVGTGIYYLADLATNSSTDVPTLATTSVTVRVDGSRQYTVNSAKVQISDVLASNGAADVIDQVLIPAQFGFTVADALVGYTGLEAYVSALQNAGLLTLLGMMNTQYTVFVPSTVDKNSSVASLNYTIVQGNYPAASLKDGQLLRTLSVNQGSLDNQAQLLKVTIDKDSNVFIGGIKVSKADVGAGYVANGIIHLLDGAVALPGSVASIAAATAFLSTLDSAVVLAGLSGALSGAGNLTVFAPTNDAFSALPTSVLGYLTSNSSKASNDALAHVLLYHVYGKNVLYNALGNLTDGSYQMLSGNDVVVSHAQENNKTVVKVNQATVTIPDILASNGVAHVINAVLVPGDLNVTNVDLLVGLRDTTLIQALNRTGLLANLSSSSVTIFAPTNAAFDKLKDRSVLTKGDTSDLKNILLTHVVNGTYTPAQLNSNLTLTSLSGKKLVFKFNSNKVNVNIAGSGDNSGEINFAASSSNLGKTTSSYVYSIDQVLGEEDDESSGLTSTEIGLIVAGCIVGVLLAGAAVGGAIWYYKRRHGYEQIDGDAY